MTDKKLLQTKIKAKGMLKSKILEELGISYPTLRSRMNNKSSFKADEIQKLCDILEIKNTEEKERIFFKLK